MDAFDSVREAAAKLYRLVAAKRGNDLSPLALASAAADERELSLFWLMKGDPALKGARATFDEQTGALCCEKCSDDAEAALLVAHEVGHEVLHAGTSVCSGTDIDPSRSMEAAPVGLQRVEDYGARERRELQADIFARELLLPQERAREMHVGERLGATAIAVKTGLPLNLVRQQLLDTLFLAKPEAKENRPADILKPDPSQERAAGHRGSPFLLQAGPGTGKTRTLVMKVLSLLNDGIDPSSILVLTFSNRAAGELSERITKAAPDAGAKVWIGTFHAFGLDLVRRFHDRLKLPADPKLFDRTDSIEILEELLPILPLVHFRNLWDPTMVLCDVLSGISRAKDEMVEPAGYRQLAEAMMASATDDESKTSASKCVEVAQIYDLYDDMLRNNKALDFGDLIMRPALLLETDEVARKTVQLRHRHVLVDEYQDVNRASARLLKAVSGSGENLWVVGDARQSIYRFRGASSANMVKFAADYPGAKTDKLDVNYRSMSEIVDTFVSCAPKMKASAGMLSLALTSKRGSAGARPEIRRYDVSDTELAGIAANIRELEVNGVPLKNQAVLCRGNERVNEVASALELRDIPVLHLGSFFERDEIRDLLSLLSLVVDPHADGLVRIGTLPRYGMDLQDVHSATKVCRESNRPALDALAAVEASQDVSPAGKAAVRKLIQDLAGISVASTPWEVLCTYMLDRTNIARELASGALVAERMRALATWQLFNFIREQSPAGKGLPIRRVLDRVRRLVLLAEERDLRQVPAAALQMNAVRLMTVHGSKGLEFDAVHLPGLNSVSFPVLYRGKRCPAPTGLVDGGEDPKISHEAEEECLFFVALSRARMHLRLTLCQKQDNGNKRSPSPFLLWLKAGTVSEITNPATLPATRTDGRLTQITVVRSTKLCVSDQFLASYAKCPRRFFYTHVIGLRGGALPTPYSKTHSCLFRAIEWLAGARGTATPTLNDLEAAFDGIWQEHGPKDHGLAADYRKLASKLLASLMAAAAGRSFREVTPLTLNLSNGTVSVHPSEIAELKDGTIVIRRVRTGHKRSDEYDRLEYTLYLSATGEVYGASAQVEAVHLADNLVESVEITDRKLFNRRSNAEEMLKNMSLGLFPAVVDQRSCPRCPHFFLCPATPAGDLSVS